MLDKLHEILSPSNTPIDVEESQLEKTISELGVVFPIDYLKYSQVYGSGTIVVNEEYDWEIYSAFRPTFPRFVRRFFDRQDSYRKATENLHIPLGLFPEAGGLLPFGHRDDVYFTWKTNGPPDEWTIVVLWLYQEGGYQEFAIGFVEFLVEFLCQRITLEPYQSATWNPETDISFEPEVFSG